MVSSRSPSLRSFALKAFYLAFPKVQTLSGLLSWSHYVELLSMDDTLEQGSLGGQEIHRNISSGSALCEDLNPPYPILIRSIACATSATRKRMALNP